MKAREMAYLALKKICLENVYSNLYLRKELDKADPKDKGFITQIVYGTLQQHRYVRYQWSSYVEKIPRDDICVLLDMSVYQMKCMDKVPTYAILNEAVDIAKKAYGKKVGNLVNAILHKVELQGEVLPVGSKEQILAIKTSHPDWLIAMWTAQYGYEICEKICYANMETKPQVARVNTLKTTREELLKDENFEKGEMSEDALIYKGSSLVHTPYYEDGFIAIQDEASQLVSQLLDPKENERILDVCAAPGTKSTHIAQRMKNKGEIRCGDIHEHRVELIKESAIRLGITIIHPQVMDACVLPDLELQSFDRVLCDVPCSGYGVLARKSDIKYHMKSEDMDTLLPLQQQILETASSMLKPNGILVYSTCTLNKKENEKQIEKFLKKHGEFVLLEEHTIFPFMHHSDGFYMAKLQEKG